MRFSPWPHSIRARLLLVMIVGLMLALVLSSAIFWWDRDRFARQMNVDHYVERVAAAVRLLDDDGGARRADILKVMRTGVFRADTLPAMPAAAALGIDETRLSREVQALLRERLGREAVLFRVAPLRGRPSGSGKPVFQQDRRHRLPTGFLAVVGLADGSAARFEYRLPSRDGWPVRLFLSTSILLLAVILLSVVAVRLVVRPLRQVSDQAAQIGRDLFTPAMPETGPTEARHMAKAMNTMQDKIRQLFEQRSRFLAAVSHDLRTPITRMRLRAELIEDDELRERMARDLAEMERMVQETLEFMRDGDRREALGRVDLNALVDALAQDAVEQGGEVVFEPAGRTVVSTRPLALKRCLSNLVSNAVKYGERVSISVTAQASFVSVDIDDDGPGIPDDELERVFEPFYRGNAARGGEGTGLGLSIARAIAESLGATLTLYNREAGGLTARLRLPAAAPH